MKKIVLAMVSAVTLMSFVAEPAFAKSCSTKAKEATNLHFFGTTAISAGIGCVVGAIIFHRCGGGALVGGGAAAVVNTVQYKQYKQARYQDCLNGKL